ncbi:unnamed protein product [Prorocentrum cordatum]|uniref:Uncharacterized protein n=1 Tax=Prorocentrum cordatum TaxID=2364126 RepID=A0ABN9V3C4_9DINO|nr:unnamed protein product [Polarella glacialis]
MHGVRSMLALLLSLFLATCSSDSAPGEFPDGPPAEECNGPDSEQRKRPSWRVAPYRPGAPSIYGGQYVVEAFGEHFDGPVGGDDWDLLWTQTFQVGELLRRELPPRAGRLVNHCRYFKAAGQKCHFAGHVRRVAAALARDPAQAAQLPVLRAHVLNHPAQAAQWLAEVQSAPEPETPVEWTTRQQ